MKKKGRVRGREGERERGGGEAQVQAVPVRPSPAAMAAKGDAKKGVKKEASKAGADSRGRGAGEDDGTSLPSPPALVDELFPRWEAASPAAKGDQYQDEAGRVLPKALKKVVDAWKRPGELVAGMTEVPVYAQSVALPSSVGGVEEQIDRWFRSRQYCGHGRPGGGAYVRVHCKKSLDVTPSPQRVPQASPKR